MLESMGRLSPQSLQPHKNKVNFCLSTAARVLRSSEKGFSIENSQRASLFLFLLAVFFIF